MTEHNLFLAMMGVHRTTALRALVRLYMSHYGGNGNPHLQTVADAERIVKEQSCTTT